MANQFPNFLKLAADIYKPKKQKRLVDETVKAEIEPFILAEIEKQKGEIGDHLHNIASAANLAYKRSKNI